MRGEYIRPGFRECAGEELPPRARRILNLPIALHTIPGTTSACAENTRFGLGCGYNVRNYLRVRGEYTRLSTGITGVRELPPRARRIQGKSSSILLSWGTTSACAENTFDCVPLLRAYGNYLRVRGEYTPLIIHPHTHLELPPRARRILGSKPRCSNNAGTTSACAENTMGGSASFAA